jgi:ferredoxin
MLCSTFCPNDAFEVKGYDLETRIQSLPPGEDLILSCPRATQIDLDELIVPCVGILSPAHLLALFLKRSGRIIFNVSACEFCENRAAAEHLESQVDSLGKYLHDLIKADLILLKTSMETTARPAVETRRSFFKEMKEGLVLAVRSRLPGLENDPGDGASRNRRVPGRVKLVRDLLKQLEQTKKDIVASLYLYQVQINEDCTLCPLCKGICPTGAIRMEKVDEEKSLVIDNTLCSGCGLCVTFCKNDALRLHYPEGLKELQRGTNC